MRNALCRLTVQHDGDDDAFTEVDLALPRNTHLCQLMPSIVELARGEDAATAGTRWRLFRIDGHPLEESMTLDQNDVDDGATLLLTTVAPPEPVWVPCDVSHVAARLTNAAEPTALLPVAGAVVAAAVAAAALCWAAAPMTARLATAVGMAAAAALTAAMVDRTHTDGPVGATLSVSAVMFSAAAGFVAVPAGPAAAHLLLASAAAMSMSMVLLRLTRCAVMWLTAIAAAAALLATATGVAVAWRLQPAAVGALLACGSLLALTVAPRMSMIVTGIGPSPPDLAEPVPDAFRVMSTQHVLTGLVVGATTSATVGCAVLTFDAAPPSVAFVAAVAVVLLLRTRTHAVSARRTALGLGGIATAALFFAMATVAVPGQVYWLSPLVGLAGVAGLSRLLGLTAGPVVQRIVDVIEYVAVAAVVPLACWVAGVYGAVRATGLL